MAYELEPFTFDNDPPAPVAAQRLADPEAAPARRRGAAAYVLAGASLGLAGVAGAAMVLAALFTP